MVCQVAIFYPWFKKNTRTSGIPVKKHGVITLWPCLKAINSLNTPWSPLLLCLKRCLKNTTYQHLNELFPFVKQLRNLIDSINNRYNGNMLWNDLVKKNTTKSLQSKLAHDFEWIFIKYHQQYNAKIILLLYI